jgi:hypothetical protein
MRNALSLPAYAFPDNANLDVRGISNALSEYTQGVRQDRRDAFDRDMRTKQFGLQENADRRAQEDQDFQRQDRLMKQTGALAQVIRDDADPARAGANWVKLRTALPALDAKLKEYGIDPNDHVLGSRLVAAQAGFYKSPMQEKMEAANLKHVQGQNQAQENEAKLFPYKEGMTKLQYEEAKKNAETPKIGTADLGPGHARIFYDPRTGQKIGQPLTNGDANLGPYKDMKQKVEVEEGLRKEVTQSAKEYNTVNDAAQSLDAISKAPSAAKDIAMVFQFMKILDPNSVVRETEYATAAKAAGLDDRFVGYITKIQNGQFLTPEQRMDFLNTAKTLAQSRQQGYQQTLDRYRAISQRVQVDPRNVVPDQGQPSAQPPPQQQGSARQRYHNPQTGQVIEWNGQQWVEVR